MGITDAELASGLANVLVRMTETMVGMIVSRDEAAKKAEESKQLVDATNDLAALLRERVSSQKKLIGQLTEAGKMLQERLEFEQLRNRMLVSDQDKMESTLIDEMRKRIDAERDSAACNERFEQSELRSENFEGLLNRWLIWVTKQITITDTTTLLVLIAATGEALKAAKEQGLEREEITIPGSQKSPAPKAQA